ncbi:hypothetical protein TNCT_689311 [Trichonephila clavata]|uniref:Uncharacterized protein n=1 Tax=Trichonephila clavata TaxID=2740835 RepID=A0A8X6KTY2_TRICU|nr:hypothetical protein TNCT_689311 [Trichonephila clavata]
MPRSSFLSTYREKNGDSTRRVIYKSKKRILISKISEHVHVTHFDYITIHLIILRQQLRVRNTSFPKMVPVLEFFPLVDQKQRSVLPSLGNRLWLYHSFFLSLYMSVKQWCFTSGRCCSTYDWGLISTIFLTLNGLLKYFDETVFRLTTRYQEGKKAVADFFSSGGTAELIKRKGRKSRLITRAQK